ncbi:hypothetical protein PRZ48_008569 [Zasmidium cellare]|uniref:Uncharacterized protein n=1 Tax=Zasmidium cellare TaxID=395010 RepID=A0ABR0EGG7_ZASCE|nr:hypothetical protein PRZ48_008569 [Zasmidium cellare]
MNLLPQIPDIPLHCNVCPKRPTFSDVSHLLTHIASKGHLSCYYKIKVKASTDNDAKQIIDDYDDWYADYNVEELMRERMSQKEKKRGPGSNNATRRGTNGPARGTPAPANRQRSSQQPSHRLRDNMHLVDPALGRRFSNDPLSRSDTPNSVYSMEMPTFQSHLQRGLMPAPYPYSETPLVKQESFDSDYDEEEDPAFEPNARRSTRRRRNLKSDSVVSFNEEDYLDALANDTAKLKGVFWPGMDIFDSATPEMRRKRNQKKANSVLQALQATSEIVEPTECVYDTEGVLRKEREITGNPESEDDLIEGESEPEPDLTEKKRPRRPRPRPALADKNVNTGRVTRNRAQPHHPSVGSRGKKRAAQFDGMEEDKDLTFTERPSKKRAGLSIHRDNSGPDITFDNPAQLNVLTASFRDPYQQGYQVHHHQTNANMSGSHGRDASWGQSSTFRPNNNGHGMGNFGQYFHHGSMPQAGGMVNPLAPLPQQLSYGMQGLQGGNGIFSHQGNPAGTWDVFNYEHPDVSILEANSINFGATTEMPPANPLYFHAANNSKEDDEVTISAAGSDNEK